MKQKTTILTIMFTLLAAGIYSQPFSTVKDVDILEDKYLVLDMEYPHMYDTLRIVDAIPIDEKHSRIIYIKDGVYCEAIVNKARKDLLLVASAVEVPRDEMPSVVMDAVRNSKYGSWSIDHTMAMTTPYGGWFYAIDISKDSTYARVFYDELGDFRKAPY